MSMCHGSFKMVTTAGTVYADKVRELPDLHAEAEVLSVYEYNHTTGKYRPNKSAFAWVCGKRGQEIQAEEQPDNELAAMFREMRELMDEMEYTPEERRAAVDGFISRMPIKHD